jgi:hypothetical protein
VLKTLDGYTAAELACHAHWLPYRHHGEWFVLGPIVDEIAALEVTTPWLVEDAAAIEAVRVVKFPRPDAQVEQRGQELVERSKPVDGLMDRQTFAWRARLGPHVLARLEREGFPVATVNRRKRYSWPQVQAWLVARNAKPEGSAAE